jgi:hypothetical protein
MSEYDETNKGAMWKNTSVHPKAPLLKGHINIDGVVHKISAWKSISEHPQAPVLQLKKDDAMEGSKPDLVVVKKDDEDLPF